MQPDPQVMTWGQLVFNSVVAVLGILLIPLAYMALKWINVLGAKADTIIANLKVNTDATKSIQYLTSKADKDHGELVAANETLANNLAEHIVEDDQRHKDHLAALQELSQGQKNHAVALDKINNTLQDGLKSGQKSSAEALQRIEVAQASQKLTPNVGHT